MFLTALIERSKKLKAYSMRQRKAFVLAIFSMPFLCMGLRYFGFAGMVNWMFAARALPVQQALEMREVRKLGQAVNAAARHGFVAATCLPRSLCLLWFLRRQGVMAVLRIGVQVKAGEFTAHAWVEYEGEPVNDKVNIASEYAVFNEDVPLQAFKTK